MLTESVAIIVRGRSFGPSLCRAHDMAIGPSFSTLHSLAGVGSGGLGINGCRERGEAEGSGGSLKRRSVWAVFRR